MESNYAIDSEKAILGTIIQDNDFMIKAMGSLEDNDFYSSKNKITYRAMRELFKDNINFDLTIVAEKLSKEIKAQAITLSDLTEISYHTSRCTFDSHLNLVKEKSKERKLIVACKSIITDGGSIESKVDLLQNTLLELNSSDREDKVYTMSEVMEKTLNKIEKAFNNKSGLTGISTGIQKIDNATNGLEKKDFIVFGARPSMGKTALSLSIMENIKGKVLYIQLDMSTEGMGQRLLASNTCIENGKIARGRFNDSEMNSLLNVFDRLSRKNNIFIYEPASITVNQIRLIAKEIQIKQGLDVIIVDHIGKIRPTTKGSKYEQSSYISNSLKAMAKELNVAMVALCQLSRASEQRADHRPILSDLRDTGSIEEDADVIGLLYRDGYYRAREDKEDIVDDVLEINFAKCRNGRTGVVELNYNLPTQRLSEF